MRHAPGALGHLPHQRRRLGHQDQEHPREGRVRGPVLLGQLVLAHPGGTVAERDPAPLGVGVHPAAEAAGHLAQVLLVEGRVRAGQLAPPVAEPAALLPQREVAVEHDAVHTVVAPVQQIRIVVGDLVIVFHASILLHRGRGVKLLAVRRASFSQRRLGKSLEPTSPISIVSLLAHADLPGRVRAKDLSWPIEKVTLDTLTCATAGDI